MLKRKHIVIIFLVSCLTGTLLGIGTTGSQNGIGEYDPWCDLDDDGWITIADVSAVAIKFGSYGDPINKTELLLELQDRVDSLNGTLETRIPKAGNISVPASAFNPESHDVEYTKFFPYQLVNTGLYHENFRADVQLPHGATVTSVTFYYHDYGIDRIELGLSRCNESTLSSMSKVYTPTTPYGDFVSYDNTINYATVDNNNYAYYLWVYLPMGYDYFFKLARIEYEYLP